MSGSYQAVVESRPRIRQDVLYSQTPDGVLIRNADTGFHLKSKSAYRLTCLLAPYLNGRHTVAQLCTGLNDGQRGMVGDIVSKMLERGFARDASGDTPPETPLAPEVSARFAAQLNYIDHFTDSPERRFATLRAARIAVLGDDLVARWCVAGLVRNGAAHVGVEASLDRPDTGFADVVEEVAGLVRNGCDVEVTHLASPDWVGLDGYDAVLVTDAGAAPGLITGLLADGIPDGVVLLSATTVGDRVLVGPVMTADRAGCWVCATLRFGANDESGATAGVWTRAVVPAVESASTLSAPHAAMIGNLLAYEVFRVLTGTMPDEARDAVIVQRLDSLDAVAERLLPHPACPHCGDTPGDPLTDPSPASPAMTAARDAEDTDDAQLLLHELTSRLVQPNLGVFAEFDDERFTQIPLKVARLRFSTGHRAHREVTTFDVHHLVGARSSALLAAAGAYVDEVAPLPGVVRGTGGRPAVGPDRLDIGRGTRAAAGRVAQGTAHGTAHGVAHWVPATSLLSGAEVVVPAAAVRPLGAYNRAGLCVATSAGAGAGSTVAEALGAGLASALAFHALDRAVRGNAVVALDRSAFAADPELDFLNRSAANLGLEFEVLDLGGDRVSGMHTMLARARVGDEAPLWTIGADLDRRRAVVRALRDLVGVVQVATEFPEERISTGDGFLRAFDPYTLRAGGVTDEVAIDPVGSWSGVLGRLRVADRDAFAVSTTPADLRAAGIHTVRVLLADGA
ncbi:TOMM precursor leader peptide-binding protein [Virgisporangium aurantiacum]|uniref:YcaO domain-containing protein n=1 Tax=Virgisporangium aurantiacum TaxID=175570 RepID=A0A8J3Z6B9_9ACTN|nr:TOMM precursor leader peptide-binding protein [Virgisporangium aurantiacum]GIJ56055.1 hypothetical protein Vau01_035710 [Virgisporangium aurantiacum]